MERHLSTQEKVLRHSKNQIWNILPTLATTTLKKADQWPALFDRFLIEFNLCLNHRVPNPSGHGPLYII